MDDNTRAIVTAIREGREEDKKIINGMRDSISELAKSVHEMAISFNHMARELEGAKDTLDKHAAMLAEHSPVIHVVKLIGSVTLKWVVPFICIGVVAAAMFSKEIVKL